MKEISLNNEKTIIQFLRQNIGRYRRELNTWRDAREMRYDVDYPLTYALQEVYTDAMVDTHLRAVIENRILRVVNQPFEIKGKDGKSDEKLTDLINQPWFTDVLRYKMESIFYGYNLIYFKDYEKGKIKNVDIVPREHVIPENRWIIENVTDTDKGLPFDAFPNDLVYCQMYDAYGLLEQASSLTILKRHSWGSWDEFEQIFGIPIRIAKVPSGNPKVHKEASVWLDEMGRTAAGVFEIGTEVEIIENAKTDSFRVFLEKINSVNSEVSKLINGQTMTVDNGSSRSQSEVHQTTQDEITRADKREMIYWLNNVLLPVLRNIGYPFNENHYFAVEDIVNPDKKIKIDAQLMAHGYKMTPEYIERVYGVELDKSKEKEDPKTEPVKKKS